VFIIKTFIVGTLTALFLTSLIVIFNNWNMAMTITGIIGVAAWGLAGILSGAFISGDRLRANYATESREDARMKNKWTNQLFLFGLPYLSVAFIIYFAAK
jgi:hypothetical protein